MLEYSHQSAMESEDTYYASRIDRKDVTGNRKHKIEGLNNRVRKMKKDNVQQPKRLRPEQIEAARRLYTYCDEWKTADSAFESFRKERLKKMTREEIIIRVAATNDLYSANEHLIVQAAQSIADIMLSSEKRIEEILLADHNHLEENILAARFVETLAEFPVAWLNNPDHNWSLASKFAHFFIDENHFPIYDTYSRRWVAYHALGKTETAYSKEHLIKNGGVPGKPYLLFFKHFYILKKMLEGSGYTNSDIDRYLWLRGQYEVREKPKVGNRALKFRLFTSNQKEIKENLSELEMDGETYK